MLSTRIESSDKAVKDFAEQNAKLETTETAYQKVQEIAEKAISSAQAKPRAELRAFRRAKSQCLRQAVFAAENHRIDPNLSILACRSEIHGTGTRPGALLSRVDSSARGHIGRSGSGMGYAFEASPG